METAGVQVHHHERHNGRVYLRVTGWLVPPADGLSPTLRVESHVGLHLDVLLLVLENHRRLVVHIVVVTTTVVAAAADGILTQQVAHGR